jgi:NADPH:quinone reductase-like Zn-dependent oxidoreductase
MATCRTRLLRGAASVNGADWKVRIGQYKQSKFPFPLGRDFSGVQRDREGVTDLKVGDAVFGVCEIESYREPLRIALLGHRRLESFDRRGDHRLDR